MSDRTFNRRELRFLGLPMWGGAMRCQKSANRDSFSGLLSETHGNPKKFVVFSGRAAPLGLKEKRK
jgi:hypothetical protein